MKIYVFNVTDHDSEEFKRLCVSEDIRKILWYNYNIEDDYPYFEIWEDGDLLEEVEGYDVCEAVEKEAGEICLASYITEWDEGETVLKSRCRVNLTTREIIQIYGPREVIRSPYSDSELDDNIETLEKQYIKLTDGSQIDVVDSEDWISECQNEDYDDITPFYINLL